MDGRAEGSRDLVLAIFRLAVADYLGLSYGHDAPHRCRRVASAHRDDAARFLSGRWAAWLADQIGISGAIIWREAQAKASQLDDLPLTRAA